MPRKRILTLAAEEYLNLLRSYKKYLAILGFSQNGQDIKYAAVVEFLTWLEKAAITSVQHIKGQHIKSYYDYLLQRPNKYQGGLLNQNTINHHLNALRGFFSFLQESNHLLVHPMSSLNFSKQGKSKVKSSKRIALSEGQVRDIYRACETAGERALLSLAYGCGLRNGEIVSLNISDIKMEQKVVIVQNGKGSKRRAVPMSTGVQNDLQYYLDNERELFVLEETKDKQAVFYNSRGGRMQGYTLRKMFNGLIARSQNPSLKNQGYSLHTLRHSIATHLLQGGLSVEQVRNFLGHSHTETTEIYTHINQEQLRQLIQ